MTIGEARFHVERDWYGVVLPLTAHNTVGIVPLQLHDFAAALGPVRDRPRTGWSVRRTALESPAGQSRVPEPSGDAVHYQQTLSIDQQVNR